MHVTAELETLITELLGPVADAADAQLNRYSGQELDVLITFFAESHEQRTQRTKLLSGKADVA